MSEVFNISGAMVVYNEDKVVRKALECLKKFTDEIIVFDSFSTDKTMDILKEFNCKIFQHEFDNHRDQKNRAIEKCEKDWIFLLDADEYLDDKLLSNIQNLINNKDGIDCFALPRKNYLDGDGPHGYPDIQSRLFRSYCRHHGHWAHHRTDGNAKKHIQVLNAGSIIHEKTWARQEAQNRLYYSLDPSNYKEPPRGAENVILDQEIIKNSQNPNAYKDFIMKNKEK